MPHSEKASKFWAQPNRPFGEKELSEMIRGILRKSFLNEKEFETFKSDIEKKDTFLVGHGQLYNRSIESYLKAITDKLGVIPDKFIGRGSSGYAFLTTDGKVLKITTDISEIIEAKKYFRKDVNHLPKIYNIYKIQVGKYENKEIYCILKEYILQNERFIELLDSAKTELNYQLKKFSRHLRLSPQTHKGVDNQNFPNSMYSLLTKINDNSVRESNIQLFLQYLKKESKPITYWFALQIISLNKELEKFNIMSRDFTPNNMGIKNKKLIFLDVGNGDIRGDGLIRTQPFDIEIAQENINEDDEHFQNIQSSIQNKLKNNSGTYHQNGKLEKRELQEYLKVLYKQHGIKPVKFLGAGFHGYAFLTEDGRTLKITTDKTEAVEANKIKGSNAKHFQKIYNIFKIKVGDGKDKDVYALLKEHILQNESLIKQLIYLDKLACHYYNKMRLDSYVTKYGYFPTTLEISFKTEDEKPFNLFFENVKKENVDKLLLWYLLQMRSLYQEMNKLGIKTNDVVSQNLGLKNKTLINIDARYGDYGNGWVEKQPYDAQVAQENKKL